MSLNAKKRVCLTLESLEGRLVADAKMPALMPAALGNVAVVGTAANHGPQILSDLPAAPTKAAAQVKSASASYAFTAFTIDNNSTATVAYSIKWGNGPWTSYTLAPHQSRTQYIAGLNQTATISYDKSFAAGYQEQQYTLSGTNVTFPAGFYLVAPTPSFGVGHHYQFGNVSGGVQLYS